MISSVSWTNHSTRSLPWNTGRVYSSEVGQYNEFLQTETTDGFHVTSDSGDVGEQVVGAYFVFESGFSMNFGFVLGDVGEHAVDGEIGVGADLLVTWGGDHAGGGNPAAGDGCGVGPVFDAEGFGGFFGGGEWVVGGVGPVVEHGLEGGHDFFGRKVFDVVEFGFAVGLVESSGEHVDGAVVVDGAEDVVEVDGAVKKVPGDVALQGPEVGVGGQGVGAGGPGDGDEVFVSGEVEPAEGELFVALGVRCGLDDGHVRSLVRIATGVRRSRFRTNVRWCRHQGSFVKG